MTPTHAQSLTDDEVMHSSEPPLRAGSCILQKPELATIVQLALTHFDDVRYRLAAWCIMPNHVHVVVTPTLSPLRDILHSWKSFTAKAINGCNHRSGTVWQEESFDHAIRTLPGFTRFVSYTENNPVAAGLCSSADHWPFSSAGTGYKAKPFEFVDPRTTEFVLLKSRGVLPHLHKPGCTYFVTWRLRDALL